MMPSDADTEIGKRVAAGSTSDDDRFPRAALEFVGAVAAAEGRAAGRAEERRLSFAGTAGVEQAHRQISVVATAERDKAANALVRVQDTLAELADTYNEKLRALEMALAKLDICQRYAEMEGADGDCAELANDHGGTKFEEDPACRAVEDLRDRYAALLAKHAALRDVVRASLPTPLGPGLEYVQAALAASDLPDLDDKARCLYASILLEAVYHSLMKAGDKRLAARCDGARAIAEDLLRPGTLERSPTVRVDP